MIKNDAKSIAALALAALVTHGVAPKWCGWVMKGTLGDWLQKIYDFLTEYAYVRCALAGIVVLCGIRLAWRVFRDKDFRWYRPVLLVWMYVLLYDQNNLDFVSVWNGLTFKGLANTIGLMIMVAMMGKLADRYWHFTDRIVKWWREKPRNESKPETEKGNGFPNDDIKPQNTPKALQQYAEVITEQLLCTNLSEHSFAVGITGEWGSGKTTFLELLQSKLLYKAEIVSFNPWMCRTPEQVTEDFFASMQHQLSPRHSSLSKPLRDYARYITNATLSWGHGFLSKLTLAFPQESLQEKKERLSKRFAKLHEPVVVFIDDLDRLESSEVFEVLRLIRNTADLKNTIYVVAYDKEYVSNVLVGKNIMNPVAYLEKIFPVEIHQPKVEDYQIMQVLYKDMNRVTLFNGTFANELFNRIKPDEKQLIVKILGNYRQARRFVRVYTLNVMYIQRVFTNEIKLTDLFWMELLQTYDKTIYDILGKEPLTLLYLQGGKYKLRPGVAEKGYMSEQEKRYEYNGERKWKDGTEKILELLFGKYVKESPSSICHAENYVKFFTLGVSPYKLSKHELNLLFTKKGEEETTVRGWIDDGKYYSSVLYQLENCKVENFNNDALTSYIKGILAFGLTMGEYGYDVGRSVRSMLEARNYKGRQHDTGKKIVLEWLNEQINAHRSPTALSILINRLYRSTEYDDNGRKVYVEPLLISNDDVEMMLKELLKDYLNLHQELTAIDLYYEKSDFGKVFINCSVMTDEGMMDDEYTTWKNVGIDVVIEHFKGRANLSIAQKNDAEKKMFMDNIPNDDDNDPEIQDWIEHAYEQRADMLEKYFGSDLELRKRLETACFVDDVEIVKEKKAGGKKNENGPKSDGEKKKSKTKLKKEGKWHGK